MEDEEEVLISGSSEDRKGKPLTKKQQLLTAGAIFWGNIALGIILNTYGPTVTSFQNKYGKTDSEISIVFSIFTGSYMVGALSGGVMFNYVNRQFAALCLLATMGVMMFLTPHCPSIGLYFATAAITGFCGGGYDTSQFVWMMEMLKEKCPPFVMSQHFFYALGASLSGLIMAPFLDQKKGDDGNSTATTTTMAPDGPPENDKLFIPFSIVGFIIGIGVAYQLLLFIFVRYYPPPPEENESNDTQEQESNSTNEGESVSTAVLKPAHPFGVWTWPKLRMIVLCCCFYGAYSGMETNTFQFFPKFGQNSDLHLSESDSSYVLTGMTSAFAVGRAIAIVAVFKIPLQIIICVNLAFVVVANTLLVTLANTSLPVLWTCGVLYGFGFSSLYPSFSAFMERYITFTNFVTSLMILCGAGVGSIYPLVIGKFIEHNPIVLGYVVFFSVFIVVFAFGTLSCITFKNKQKHS
ncbi:Sodium-dependent glucose transporter 1 [Orchesella cincta]|uniref:Sodium-dependent glucose transporter 1 n=1 Tax=Orchesella cincta TaxID=48709 RepID=A0A1D2N9B0_ORCCI|nr:Sodium-dependent glucose transporter 1 [Orchesella cincta]